MDDSDLQDEVDVTLKVAKDSKKITLTFTSKDPFTVASFIMELETYLPEISQASDQMDKPGVDKH